MKKTVMVLLLLVSLVAMMTTAAHAQGRPMISPTSSGGSK